MFKLAQAYPEKSFLAVSGFLCCLPNFGTLGSSQLYQPRYLSGLVAGAMTKSNQIGHIGTFPIWDIYLQANSFYIGIKETNPDAHVVVTMLQSWFNEDLEGYQTNVLFDHYSVDTMSQASNSNQPQFISSNRRGVSIGLNTDASEFVSQDVVVSVRNIWGTVYKYATRLVMQNNYSHYEDRWIPISEEAVDISPFSVRVSDPLQAYVLERRQELINGSRQIFCGKWAAPFLFPDNYTSIDLPSDVCLSNDDMFKMDKFLDGIQFIGTPTIPTTRIDLPSSSLIAMQTLSGICIVILIVFIVLIILYRKTNMIYFASPIFCIISLVGAILVLVVVFLLSPQPPTPSSCISIVWVLVIGFGTFIGAIIAKTWRVFILHKAASQFRFLRVTNMNLFFVIGGILSLEILFLILFSVVDTPAVRSHTVDTPYEYRISCFYSSTSSIFLYCLLALNAFLILICVVGTFLTRNTQEVFNESQHLTVMIYIIAFVYAILIPLYVIVSDPSAQYLLACLGLILGTISACCTLMLPKFYIIWRGKDELFAPFKNSKLGSIVDLGNTGPQLSTMSSSNS